MKTFLIAAGLALGMTGATAASAAPAPQPDGRHDNGRHNGWDRGHHDNGRHHGWDRGHGHGWNDHGWRGHHYGPRCRYTYHHRRVCYR